MGDVVGIEAPFYGPVKVDDVLKGALAANLKEVVVIGKTQDGTIYLSATTGEAAEINFMCDCAKKLTMDACFVEVEE